MSIRGMLSPQSLSVVAVLSLLVLVVIHPPIEASGETGEQSPPIVYVSTAGGGISEFNGAIKDPASHLVRVPLWRRETAQIPIGNGPISVAITPDGTRV